MSACSVAGIQVGVERAGPESPLGPIHSVQGGFLAEGRFRRPLGGWEESRQGNVGVGLRIQDRSHKASLSSFPPDPLGTVACEEGALSSDCIWLLPPGWGPDGLSVATTHPSVINTLRKVSCILPAQFHVCGGEKEQGLLTSLLVGELVFSPPAQLPPIPKVEEPAGEGPPQPCRVHLIVLAFLKLTKTMPYVPREKRMGEII